MKESLIRDYLDDEIGALSLMAFLPTIRNVSMLRKDQNLFCDLTENYNITPASLKKICDDYLLGLFDESAVEALAFFLVGSDHFYWDNDTESGAIVAELIHYWNSPEITFPINRVNMGIVSRDLAKGVFDINHLKINLRANQ